jgi:hypothetical protein
MPPGCDAVPLRGDVLAVPCAPVVGHLLDAIPILGSSGDKHAVAGGKIPIEIGRRDVN